MAQPRDPFYAVKDKVQQSLTDLRASIGRAEEVLKQGGQANEVEPVLQQARSDISLIHIDVKDLSQTITIVEENRSRFPSIDNRELDSRRGFVTDAKTSLSQYDEQIKRIATRAQSQAAKKKALLQGGGGLLQQGDGSSRFQSSANDEAVRANDDYVASSRQSAQLMEHQQDIVLDDMSHALERLQGISDTINTQLVENEHQLGELGEDLDQAKLSMDNALKKMNKLLKSSDKGRLCCIVLLFVLAIALFFGVVYG